MLSINYRARRFLTNIQIANVCHIPIERIKDAARRIRKEFAEGEIYKLEGNDLAEAKAQIAEQILNAPRGAQPLENPLQGVARAVNIYSEEGALRLVKALRSKEAYDAFLQFSATYFGGKDGAVRALDILGFGQFRWFFKNNDPWFVAADVCKILDIKNPRDVVSRLDDDEKASVVLDKDGVIISVISNDAIADANHSSGGWIENRVNIVNEFGLYRIIMNSRMPKAKEFQRKVCHEILPSIRKYGYYSVKQEPVQGSLFTDAESPKKIRSRKVNLAVVYAIEFKTRAGALLVKIGHTGDLNDRIARLEAAHDLDFVRAVSTEFMPLDDARKLEVTVQAKLADFAQGAEFFSCPFQTPLALLTKHNDDERADRLDRYNKLLDLADKIDDGDAKTKVLLAAANLLIDNSVG